MRLRRARVVNQAFNQRLGGIELATPRQQQRQLKTGFGMVGVEHEAAFEVQLGLAPLLGFQFF